MRHQRRAVWDNYKFSKRTKYSPDYWTFTGEEIDSGAVESHFLTVATALGSDARGYR